MLSPPHVSYSPDPEYSEEARKVKYQGTIVLSLIVDSSGAPTDVQIIRPFGLGLDEKADKAVSAWKFRPAEKDGEPVPVAINVEVTFHLY